MGEGRGTQGVSCVPFHGHFHVKRSIRLRNGRDEDLCQLASLVVLPDILTLFGHLDEVDVLRRASRRGEVQRVRVRGRVRFRVQETPRGSKRGTAPCGCRTLILTLTLTARHGTLWLSDHEAKARCIEALGQG